MPIIAQCNTVVNITVNVHLTFSFFCWIGEPLLSFPAPCVPPSHCAAIRSLVLWLAAAFSRRFASNMSCSASFCFFIICLLLLQRFSFLHSLQTFLFLFISGCGLFLEHWQIFSVSCMCAVKPTNQISSGWYLFHFLVFVDGIFEWQCELPKLCAAST